MTIPRMARTIIMESRPSVIELTEEVNLMEVKPKNPINAKVGAGALAGAIAYMILRAVSGYGIVVTPEDASMLTLIVAALGGYFKRE